MTRLLLAIGIVLTLRTTAGPQPRPDFSGTWKLDEERSISPTYAGFVGPVVWVIAQSPDTMTVEIRRGGRAYTIAFPLADKPFTAPASKPPSYRGYWDGESLVTESTQDIE